jgi:ZIP family zinc transporter
MACAIPLWASTQSYTYVLFMTLLNGLAEPIGVVIGGYLLKDNMGPEVLSASLALVAGIMACISLHELFPTSIEYAGKNRSAVALFVGMFCTFGALEIVHSIMHDHGDGHHDHSGHHHH